MKNYDQSYFHNLRSFKNYNLACSYAVKINELRDKGCLIIDNNNDIVSNDFVFGDDREPFIGTQEGGSIQVYFGFVYDNNSNKICIEAQDFQGVCDIKKFFNSFKVIEPKSIKKIKLEDR